MQGSKKPPASERNTGASPGAAIRRDDRAEPDDEEVFSSSTSRVDVVNVDGPAARTEGAGAGNTSLKAQLAKLSQQAAALEKSLDDQRRDREGAVERLERATERCIQLEAKVTGLESETTSLRLMHEAAIADLKTLRAERDGLARSAAAAAADLGKLEEENEALRAPLEEAMRAGAKFEEEVTELRERQFQETKKATEREKELAKAKDEVTRTRETAQKADKEISVAREEAMQAREAAAKAEDSIRAAREEASKAREEATKLRAEVTSAKEDNTRDRATARDRIDLLERALEDARGAMTRSEADLASARSSEERVTRELEAALTRAADAEMRANVTSAARATLEQNVRRLREEIGAAFGRIGHGAAPPPLPLGARPEARPHVLPEPTMSLPPEMAISLPPDAPDEDPPAAAGLEPKANTPPKEAKEASLPPNEAKEAKEASLPPNEAKEANEANEASLPPNEAKEANEANEASLPPNEANEANEASLPPNEANEAVPSDKALSLELDNDWSSPAFPENPPVRPASSPASKSVPPPPLSESAPDEPSARAAESIPPPTYASVPPQVHASSPPERQTAPPPLAHAVSAEARGSLPPEAHDSIVPATRRARASEYPPPATPTGMLSREELLAQLVDPERTEEAAFELKQHPEWLRSVPPMTLIAALQSVDYDADRPVFELARIWEREPLCHALIASLRAEPDPRLREHGAWLLKHLAAASSWKAIADLARSNDEGVQLRRWLLEALDRLAAGRAVGWRELGDVVTTVAKHPDAALRDGVVGILVSLDRSDEKRRLLLDILRDDDDEVVLASAVNALASVLPMELDPAVVERLLGHPSARVQRSVRDLIERAKQTKG